MLSADGFHLDGQCTVFVYVDPLEGVQPIKGRIVGKRSYAYFQHENGLGFDPSMVFLDPDKCRAVGEGRELGGVVQDLCERYPPSFLAKLGAHLQENFSDIV